MDKNGVETNIGLCLDIFQDEFDGLNVVLSDREAAIDLKNVRSYNNQTVVPEVSMKIK